MGGAMGAVVFSQLTLSDNMVAGFEVEEDINPTDYANGHDGSDIGRLDGATIVGRNPANAGTADTAAAEALCYAALGVITPRTERYWVKNVFFAHFDWEMSCKDSQGVELYKEPAAAIGTCSLCYSERSGATDSDARTTFVSGIRYNQNIASPLPHAVTRVIRYQYPYKAIIKDTDCSLIAGNGNAPSITGVPTPPPCWYAPAWRHNQWPGECWGDQNPVTWETSPLLVGDGNLSHLGGMYCSTPIRRVVLLNAEPRSMNGKPMYIARNDL